MTTANDLADMLLDLVEAQLGALARGPLPRFELPGALLGHEVGADVRADLLFTLGLLHEAGRKEVDGIDVADAISSLLAGVHGRRTHTFYSYRVAETVARYGRFDAANPVLAPLDDAQREQVAVAVDSTEWLELLDAGILPRNYAAVLARCEHARHRLGLLHDTTVLDELLGRVTAMLGGHLDDSNARIGRYDIYTVDIHLFCEPLAAQLGEPWRAGALAALGLVDRVATRDGAAVPWGRSTGVLATCHTIELAGLVARHDLVEDVDRWVARAEQAAPRLDGWFRDGWVTAHQHRSSDPYRGLDRRLQMTLDCLGKLVDAAVGLQLLGDRPVPHDVALFGDRDELVLLDGERNAAVWAHRSRHTAFDLPLVGGTTTDYLPAPRNPGLFEVPVGSALVTGTPLLLRGDRRFAAGGLPVELRHEPGRVHARYEGFPAAGHLEPEPPERDHGRSAEVLGGTREVTWRVEGRTLTVEEQLTFDQVPDSVTLQVTEANDRPLAVRFHSDAPHRTATVDTSGLAEYRSCWGELPRVHQIDLDPAPSLGFRWSVTPLLRVLSTAVGAAYNDLLYAPLADRVRISPLPHSAATDPARFASLLERVDVFHLHWPEWLLIGGVDAHEALIEGLRRARVPVVWTQHNLLGHDKNPETRAFYERWAAAVDLVVHHSRWGRDRALATYRYAPWARHVVIPHAHFGAPGGTGRDPAVRESVERELGLRPGALRLGVVGAPRVEKDVELVMRAVARCARDDIELLVLSLRGDEAVPDDPRVVARRYEEVPREEYDRRLQAIDALVMPFDPDGEMLTTGTVGDAIGHGLPTLASSWEFLAEALGDAAITYGRTEDDLVACLDALDRASLDRAAAAAVGLRPRHEWHVVADELYAELDRLPGPHH